MSEEVRGRVGLDCNSYIASIQQMIGQTTDFRESITKARSSIESIAKARVEATIKVKKDPAIMQVREVKEAINRLKQNRPIEIAIAGMAKEKIRSISHTIGDLTGRPHRIIFEAINKTRHVIASIRDSIFSLKTLAAGIVFGGATKGLFNWTLGSAMRNEDYLSTLQTVLNSKRKGSQALSWSYKKAEETPFDAEDVVKGVSDLATSQLDYKKFLIPLGNLAKVKNRPLQQAIEFASTLKSGDMGEAVMRARELGISKSMWQKAGMKFDKSGHMTNSPEEALNGFLQIIKNNHWNKLMENQSKNASGRVSNIGDTIASMGRSIAGVSKDGAIEKGGMFAEFKKQISTIQPILESLQKSQAFASIKRNINSLVASGGKRLTNWLKDIEKHPEKIDQAFQKAKSGIKEFVSDFKLIGSAAKTVFDMLKPVLKLIVAHPKTAMGLWAGFKFGPGLISNLTKMPGRIRKIKSEFIALKTALSFLKNLKISKLKNMFSIFKNLKHIKSAGNTFKSLGKSIKTLGNLIKMSMAKFRLFGSVVSNVLKNKLVRSIRRVPSLASKAFSKLGSVLKGSGKIIIKVAKTIGTGIKRFGKVIGSSLKVLLNVVRIVSRGMIRAIMRVTAVMLANPIVAIITAIIAICAVLYEAWKHDWGGIREKTATVINFIKGKVKDIQSAFEYVKKKCSDFKESIINMWNNIKTVLSHPIQAVVSLVQHGNLSGVKEHALGTSYFGGGWTWVGEKGPELINLSPGTQILDNKNSMRKATGGGNATLNIQNVIIREEADINKFADRFAEILYRKQINRA